MAVPVKVKHTEIDNLPGDEVEFSIGNPWWVMKSLSKLYSNSILATIREYSTNAYDSHLEAGLNVPIKVTLPTLMHPYFDVEDFGVGMSEDELRGTYTQFGTSTKRASVKATGMLGFGSKAALAYTDTFTVTARKDGIQSVAVITRKADFTKVTLRVVQTSKTDKPNGVKISIPASDYNAFASVAKDFYRFWQPGTVLVDGVKPAWAVGEKLDDDLYFSLKEGTSYVVMNKVGYRIANPEALFRNRGMKSFSFVAYLNPCLCAEGGGEPHDPVEFTPSREDLEYTEHTKANLQRVITNFESKVVGRAKKDIETASDYFDAYSKYRYWADRLGSGPFGSLEFRGEKFVDAIPFSGWRYKPSEMRHNMFAINNWNVSNMKNTLIVTGIPSVPSSHHKGRARQYRDLKGISATLILFTQDTKVESVWIDPNRVIDWETVKEATKKPRQPGTHHGRTKAIKGSFDYVTRSGTKYDQLIPDNTNLYYIALADDKRYSVQYVLNYYNDDSIVVILPANRVAKFTRENPKVKEFLSVFRDKVELDGMKFLDKETIKSLSIGPNTKAWAAYLKDEPMLDPEWAKVRDSIVTADKLDAYNKAYNLARYMKMESRFKKHEIVPNDEGLYNKYPLLKNLARITANRHEVALYLNAKYAEINMKGKR